MQKAGNKIFIVGALLVLIGASIQIIQFQIHNIYIAPIVFILGTIGVLVGRYMQPYTENNFRIKRLKFQQFISSCLLVISAYLMFTQDKKWILSLFIAAIIDLIIIFRTPKEK